MNEVVAIAVLMLVAAVIGAALGVILTAALASRNIESRDETIAARNEEINELKARLITLRSKLPIQDQDSLAGWGKIES